ncbi:MAG: hypothetical protein IPM80_09380 [Proteobacteria bacterium]|nr:hypothetical protein [Pseudomonadota bacterium]
MIRTHSRTRCTALLLTAALVAACSTPPPKPPKPKPLVSEQAARPPAPDGQSGNTSAGGGPGAAGSGQGYGATSANAAEVQEEEVAADGSTRVVSSRGHARPAPAGARSAAGGGAGGAGSGGAPMDASAVRTGDGRSAAGAAPPPRHDDTQGVVGIHYQQGPTSDGDAGGEGEAAGLRERNATARAKQDGGRLGVDGGRDERGTSLATPPAASGPGAEITPAVIEDDILAQQLREAAEQEKDPQLRARLWAEYRKYKAGL